MRSEDLHDAADALEQGRTDDTVAFLREAVRAAETAGDAETLAAAADLARRIPGDEARQLAETPGPAGTASQPVSRLRWLVPLLLFGAFLTFAQVSERVLDPASPGEADLLDAPDLAPARTLSGSRVYLAPLGRFDDADPDLLAEQLERTYGLDAEVLRVTPLFRFAFDPDRDQLNADALLATLARRFPVSGPRTVVIGLTDFDAFRGVDPGLRYVFSARANGGYAVVSSARMRPGLLERLLRRDRTEERIRKMLERNVGVLYYGLQLRPDRRASCTTKSEAPTTSTRCGAACPSAPWSGHVHRRRQSDRPPRPYGSDTWVRGRDLPGGAHRAAAPTQNSSTRELRGGRPARRLPLRLSAGPAHFGRRL